MQLVRRFEFCYDCNTHPVMMQAQAFNDADFRVPDQAGWNPQRKPIDAAFPITHVLRTDLHLHRLAGLGLLWPFLNDPLVRSPWCVSFWFPMWGHIV